MEQEQATMSVSLEDAAPAVVETPPPAAAAPPPAVETPPNQDEPEPEGTILAANGEKLVPLGALRAERGKRKDAEKALETQKSEFEPLKQKAVKYDEAASYLQQAKPYIEKAKADLQRQHAPVEPRGPLSPTEAEEYAKDFDLYTADGKPDIVRAQRIAARHEKMSERKAQQMVTPLVQNEAQRTSQMIYQQIIAQPEINGFKLDKRFLDEAWQAVPPEMIAANPNVANVVRLVAMGRQIESGHKPVQAPPPVVETASVGTGAQRDQPLTQSSQRFQQASRMKPAEFKETREKYTPGAPNSLE